MLTIRSRKALVVGWFSYEQQGATAGDLLTRDLVSGWLQEAGMDPVVVVAPPFRDGCDWRHILPEDFTDVVFVCGPFGNGWPITELLDRFAHCRIHGVNLTMLQPLSDWNPFATLFERDSSRTARPDLSFVTTTPSVPLVGLILVNPQKEYAGLARHTMVDEIVREVLAERDLAVVPIDTRLDLNSTNLHSAAQVESLIARMDVVVTTRLHGTVLALKNGVPVVAIDPIAGGAKVSRQAGAVGWPILLNPETLDRSSLRQALDACLMPAMRNTARDCGQFGRSILEGAKAQIIESINGPD